MCWTGSTATIPTNRLKRTQRCGRLYSKRARFFGITTGGFWGNGLPRSFSGSVFMISPPSTTRRLASRLDAKSYSIDPGLTLKRACYRMVEFSKCSVPILMKKHPDYGPNLALRFLEEAPSNLSGRQRAARTLFFTFLSPAVANAVLRYLDRNDHKPRFNPPAKLYQLALVGFYLIGVRSREGI